MGSRQLSMLFQAGRLLSQPAGSRHHRWPSCTVGSTRAGAVAAILEFLIWKSKEGVDMSTLPTIWVSPHRGELF